jgi:hypothetical protein
VQADLSSELNRVAVAIAKTGAAGESTFAGVMELVDVPDSKSGA